MKTGWMMCLAAALAACGGDEPRAEDPSTAAAPSAEAPAPATVSAAPAPASSPPVSAARAGAAPQPTAADSAAAAREDVSPEWKMNQRNMAPYADCMAKANSAPENVRARLQAACANLPDAPR